MSEHRRTIPVLAKCNKKEMPRLDNRDGDTSLIFGKHNTPLTMQGETIARIREGFELLVDKEKAVGPNDRLSAICDYGHPPVIYDFLPQLQELIGTTRPTLHGKPRKGPPIVIHAPEGGLWTLSGGLSVDLLERFRTLAARAGLALGARKDEDPEGLWLHELLSFVREYYPDFITPKIAAPSDPLWNVDEIHRVCEASATLCSRLEKQSLEQTETETPQSTVAQNSAKAQSSNTMLYQNDTQSQRRARVVEEIVNQLKTVKPQMHNEAHYDPLRQQYPDYLIFKIAEKYTEVKTWIENVQDRRDVVKLAEEIAARYFGKKASTIHTDRSHRNKPHRKKTR